MTYFSNQATFFRGTSKPYIRWWWLAGPFRKEDIVFQLDWVKSNGFGGVELAWLYPLWILHSHDLPEVIEWIGQEWTDLVAFTKHYAETIGLGCDFTFGSSWPFGGSCVALEDAVQTFDGPSAQRLHASWEQPTCGLGRIVDHLSRTALRYYADALRPAFLPALAGSTSALFCDSLELDTHRMWSSDLWVPFEQRFGYSLKYYKDELDANPDVRYDYRKFIAETFLREFFQEFTEICHEMNAYARVQCHGAPVDLLAAYAAVDAPESEGLLFEPPFSRIPASAAALASKPVVSAETFTCIYGLISQPNWEPMKYWRREQTADLKLLADAIFANGVNHIVWHGMPYNPPGGEIEFYASVHVSPNCAFANELPDFNNYLERVSSVMRRGKTYSNLAIYLPAEDNLMLDELPGYLVTPGATYYWEMRHIVPPPETEGYHPLWVSAAFLKNSTSLDGKMHCGDASFSALYVDCEWLDADALIEILRLARQGLRIILKRQPRQPGKRVRQDYELNLRELERLPNVSQHLSQAGVSPLVEGDNLPWFWARVVDEDLFIFFAHPKARAVSYPMKYGQSLCSDIVERDIVIHANGRSIPVRLRFDPYQSLLLLCSADATVGNVDIKYRPPAPVED
jgi:hypothetical protein